jgi:dephospho-CoA kinase
MIRSATAPPRKVLRVALTGGIATGKSEVAGIFRELGATVLDADSLGHEIMEPGSPAHDEIRSAFGDEVLAADGRIDRSKLAPRVFVDAAARHRLNAILHPRILSKIEERLQEFAGRPPGGIIVVEAALLIEAGADRIFDRIVVTHCDAGTQSGRLERRDGLSRSEAKRRIASQTAPRRRLDAADYVIDTSGSPEETRSAARRTFAALRRDLEAQDPIG